jgi:hypothetical protein
VEGSEVSEGINKDADSRAANFGSVLLFSAAASVAGVIQCCMAWKYVYD